MYPYQKFLLLKGNIVKFHNAPNVSDKLIIFVNLCTLLIILLHFKVGLRLRTNKKDGNLMTVITRAWDVAMKK